MENNAKRTKDTVVLTNWKRLSNVPIEPNKVFAVHWRDFIVIVDDKANVLLYNPKWNMWSKLLPNLPGVQPAEGCPLVAFDDKLLLLGENGKIYELLPESGRWEMSKSLDPNINMSAQRITAALLCSVADVMFLIYGIENVVANTTRLFKDTRAQI